VVYHVFSVYCSAHGCRLYSARRLLKTDALALLIEDQAPGHIGDTDTYLAKQDAPNASGWKHERVVELRKLKVHRCIIPRHGTPVLCVNDQLHGWVHREIKADLSEQVGLGQDLCSRPKGRAARPFFTAGGSRRGPDEIMMARALFRVASRLTRFQVCCASRKYAVALVVDSWFVRLFARVARIYFMLAFVSHCTQVVAAYIRLGYLHRDEMPSLLQCQNEEVEQALYCISKRFLFVVRCTGRFV